MESLLTATAEYLTRQSVQIVVVFVLVAVVCWALRKTSAHWRYLLWLVVLAKCLAPGLIRVPLAVLPQETDLQQTSPVATPQPVAAPSTTAVLVVAATTEPEMPIASPQPITTPAGTTQLETAPAVGRAIAWDNLDERSQPEGVAGGGVVFGSGRVSRSCGDQGPDDASPAETNASNG